MLSWPKKNSRPTNIKAHPRWTEESNRLKKSWRQWGWTKGEVSLPVELQRAKHFKTSSKNIEGSKIIWWQTFSRNIRILSFLSMWHRHFCFYLFGLDQLQADLVVNLEIRIPDFYLVGAKYFWHWWCCLWSWPLIYFGTDLLLPSCLHWQWWFLCQSLLVVPDLLAPMNSYKCGRNFRFSHFGTETSRPSVLGTGSRTGSQTLKGSTSVPKETPIWKSKNQKGYLI